MKNRSLLTVNEDFELIFNAEIGKKMGYAKFFLLHSTTIGIITGGKEMTLQ
jgi:hypothetical protein